MTAKTVSSKQRLTKTKRDKALREAILPHVADLINALVGQGMGREEALKTIRWATYRLTKPEPGMEAPARVPGKTYTYGGDNA